MKLKSPQRSTSTDTPIIINNVTTYPKLSVLGAPTTPESVVNKDYVDSIIGGSSSAAVGDIKISAISTTPTGFLRCNGGQVNKTTYSALYAAIGDDYLPTIRVGNGKPHQYQYPFNDSVYDVLTTWTTGTTLQATNAYASAFVTKNRVYLLGRYNGSSYSANIYTATINTYGVIGTWTTLGTSLPVSVAYAELVGYDGYLYLIGGFNGSYLNTIYRAPINSDGTLGSWSLLSNLPFTSAQSQVVIIKNKIWIIGGYINGVRSNKTYYAELNSTGGISSWTEGLSIPATVSGHHVIVTKSRICVIGGYQNGVEGSDIYCGMTNKVGLITSWETMTPFPETISLGCVHTTSSRVYLLGGNASGVSSDKVYSAVINHDGSIGNWELFGILSGKTVGASLVVTNSSVYLLGGYVAGAVATKTIYKQLFGGLNDYSQYYNLDVISINVDNFNLPDYSELEMYGIYTYIKY